jgi:hypothetical protein
MACWRCSATDVHFVLMREPTNLTPSAGYDRMLLYQPSDRLRRRMVELHLDQRLIYQQPREDGTVYSLYHLVPR